MAIPKLAMIPSGYKDGKVYSVLPSNGDGDFTFSRGSGATRVNKDGLIETMSLELGSELVTNGGFATDSDWSKGGLWSISGGVASSDGTSNDALHQSISVPTGKIKLKFDVTSSTQGTVRVFVDKPNFTQVYQTAAVGTHEVFVDTTSNSGQVWFYATDNFIGSIDNISIKEVTSGLDTPRLDYSDSSCPSLLLEPQSTNLIAYSEDFDNASWVKLGAGTGSAAIVTSDYAISPDGTQNASRLQCDLNSGGSSSSNQSLIYYSYLSSGNQTISIYLKSNNGQNQTIYFANTQTSGDTITVTTQWQRFEFNHSTATYIFAAGLRGRSVGAIDDTADILIWGAQAENQSYATSYIPTNGAIVTRLADVCTDAGTSDTFNDSEGVLMAEISALADDETNRAITLSDGTTNNVVEMFYSSGGSNRIRFQIRVNGVGGDNLDTATTNYNVEDYNKIAIKYKLNDAQVWINGTKIHTDSNSGVPNLLSQIDFNYAGIGSNFYGKTKQIQYYNSALTDIEIEELTSWQSFNEMATAQNYTIK